MDEMGFCKVQLLNVSVLDSTESSCPMEIKKNFTRSTQRTSDTMKNGVETDFAKKFDSKTNDIYLQDV